MNKYVRHWLYALTSKYISGGAGSITAGVTASMIAPETFNLSSQFVHFIELVFFTFVGNGIINAMSYLKDNPLPKDDDDDGKGPFNSAGGLALMFFFMLSLSSCSSIDYQKSQEDAHHVASWVTERQGFIENAVAAITQVAIYSTDQDTIERTNMLLLFHVLSNNLNALIDHGNVDAESVRTALKVDETYFTPIVQAITPIIQSEIKTFQENGFGDATIEILKAVTLGIKDGTTTK